MFTIETKFKKFFFNIFLLLFIIIKIEGKNYTIESDNILSNFLKVRKITNGLVLGRKCIPTDENVEGYVFLGIPYAKPPIGQLRFQLPEDPDNWDTIFNAQNYGNACLWNSTITNQKLNYTKMDEDCLQINVFTNKYCLINSNCSVAFYIHGGAFNFDSPVILNESMIIQNFASPNRNVIFVTFQYREGLFGFSNFNHKLNLSIPSNVGMFDMIHALKWVKKEISNFGGNPNKITLTGHSSGSVAASYIYASPKARGLFNQVMLMSGTRPNLLFVDGNQNISRTIAIEVGCAFDVTDWENINDVEDVIKCLKNIDGVKLVSYQALVETFGLRLQGTYQDFGPNSFFERSLLELNDELPKMNILTGTVKEEQSDGLSTIESTKNGTSYVNKQKLQVLCQYIFVITQVENYNDAIEACINEYSSDLYRAKHIIDDINFFLPHLRDARIATKMLSKAYLYQFNYSVPYQVIDFKNEKTIRPNDSPRHSDELVYLLGLHMGIFGDKERIIAKKFSQIIVDFINNGDPNSKDIKFDSFNPSLNNYFVIDFDENYTMPGMENNYHSRADDFWNNKIPKIQGKSMPILLEKSFIEMTPLINELEDGIIYPQVSYPLTYYKNSTPPKKLKDKQLAHTLLPLILTTINPLREDQSESLGTVATISMIIFGTLITVLIVSCIMKCLKYLERRKYDRFL
ncbi:Carboxylesterase, type B domain-containing protein [Strongyloides ratti]|uniref:Carboxylic ester hydrolase n=1 Tax=Strongyloides ratti TaxID=34506 RepID=A0A090LKZ1_STRRB|nr:Carboxylesterase, type B domain-containing protein [Strongyloides ratti]CEF70499.1 Carboxylesterase, type B domain-containing protein [Strongyloides ratti]